MRHSTIFMKDCPKSAPGSSPRQLKARSTARLSGSLRDDSLATVAPRLDRGAGHIDWDNDSKQIVNLIRGLSSRPGAYSFLRDKKLKIFYAVAGEKKSSGGKSAWNTGETDGSGTAGGHKGTDMYISKTCSLKVKNGCLSKIS